MASWTDKPAQFNPYIQQQPVEAMVGVGTELQRRYNEGIQKIQSSIDRVAGLDIARDVDKEYLQGKLNDLGNKLRFVAAGDFSNYQLVNSVTGMTSKVGKDKNIQNAVISTARYRSELEKMEADREEGKLDPSNEYFFNKQANQWINNPNVGVSFKGGYVPHFDIFGFAKETFDSVKPDGMSFDQIFELDADGNPVKDENGNLTYSTYMTRLEEKGIFPQKVKETLAQIFSDPRVIQQLSISGQYVYKDFNEQSLAQMTQQQKQTILSGYDEEINRNLLKLGSAKTSDEKDQIQQVIDKLKSDKGRMADVYSSYVEQAYENPDAVRASLYKDDVRSRYTTMFGHVETSRKIMDSPAHQAAFNMQKEANVNIRFYEQLKFEKQKHADNMAMRQREFDAEYAPDGETPFNEWFTAKQTSDVDRIKYANDRYNTAQTNYRSATDDFIWEMILSNDDSRNYSRRIATLKAREGVDDYGAIGIILAEEAEKAGKPVEQYKNDLLTQAIKEYENMSPDNKNQNYIASRKYENYHQAKREFETEKNNRAMIDEVLGEDRLRMAQELSQLDVAPQNIRLSNGEVVEMSIDDIYDLATYANASNDILLGKSKEDREERKRNAEEAATNLRQRGKGDILDLFKKSNVTGASKVGRALGIDARGYWDQVFNIVDILNSPKHKELIKKQGDIIQRIYSITPKQAKPLFTGKAETNRDIAMKVASFAGAWQQGQASNESPDFKKFTVDVSSPEKNNFSVEASRVGDKTKVEIVQFDENNERVAGMTITPEQARLIGVNVNTLFESPEIRNLRNTMGAKGGKTSDGNPKFISTYTNGTADYYFKNTDFPKLANSNTHTARVNIRQDGGIFYPYVYMSDGERAEVVPLQGKDNLTDVVTSLRDMLSPSFINQYLNEYAGESNK